MGVRDTQDELPMNQADLAAMIARSVAVAVADALDGRRSKADHAANDAEEGRVAAVLALEAECKANEKAVRESPEAKAHPDILRTALLFGWDLPMFREACASQGRVKLVPVAA